MCIGERERNEKKDIKKEKRREREREKKKEHTKSPFSLLTDLLEPGHMYQLFHKIIFLSLGFFLQLNFDLTS